MEAFFAITLIIMLAAISPGPDFAMVVKNSLIYDRKSGIFTALGVSCSLIIHSTYCVLGLALIISKSLLLFSAIKYVGAAYLIFIGVKCLLSKQSVSNADEPRMRKTLSMRQVFLQGLLCNLLNPKAIMFILAFFSLVLSPTLSWEALLGVIFEIALIHTVWFSCLALMITHQYVKKGLMKIQPYIVKTMGAVLIGFGASIALLKHAIV